MANPLSQFISDRFIQPAVDARVERALSTKQPIAFGTGTVPEVSLAKSIGQPHDTNYDLLYALYKLNTDVSGSVHKWAGGVTGPGWRITTMDPKTELTPKLEKQIQDITRWLKNPNPSKLFESMLYEVVQHFGIVGDAFWYITEDKNHNPLEIWPMHPALTRIVATKQGEVLGYVMKDLSGGDPVTFTADEVLHFPLPNPTNDLYGESPLELVVEEAGIDRSALRSNRAIFQNGLNPSAIILMDESSTIDQAKQVTEAIKQAHTGASQQHKLLALAKVKDYKPSTMTPRDLEFLKLRDLATSKVTTAYRIPKVLLGYHNAGDYATTKFLIRDTYAHVYQPMQHIISAIITERLIHRFNPELRFELIKPDASDPDDIRKDQMQAKTANILTANEVRADGFGKEPLPEELAVAHTPANAPTVQDQTPDPIAGNTAEDAPTTKSLTKAMIPDDYATIITQREAAFEELAQPVIAPVANYFVMQEQDYLDRLENNLSASKLRGYVNWNSDIYDTVLATMLGSLILPSLQAGAAAAQLQIKIDLGFDQVSPLVQDYVKTQAFEHVTGINQTTRDQLRVTLSEGLGNGESTQQLSNRVSSVFTNAKGYRASLIARNETVQAYAHGNREALRATGVVTFRRWLTAPTDACPICQPLNGYTIRFEAKYPDELEPGHAHINCRCTEIGLTEEDGQS